MRRARSWTIRSTSPARGPHPSPPRAARRPPTVAVLRKHHPGPRRCPPHLGEIFREACGQLRDAFPRLVRPHERLDFGGSEPSAAGRGEPVGAQYAVYGRRADPQFGARGVRAAQLTVRRDDAGIGHVRRAECALSGAQISAGQWAWAQTLS